MKKILIVSANPYSFCIAVEHHLAKTLSRAARVDAFNMYALIGAYTPYFAGLRGLVMKLNQKFERFVAPHISGEDITERVRPDASSFPPLPADEGALRRYKVEGAGVGLGVLSSAVSVTTKQGVQSLSEYGPTLLQAWQASHVSQRIGKIVAGMGYDEIYLFNGRHCYSRPFIDMVEPGAKVIRYEAGATLDSFIMADGSIHDTQWFLEVIRRQPFDPEAGKQFYEKRFARSPDTDAARMREKQVNGLLPEGLTKGSYVVYFSSSNDEMYAIRDDHNYGVFTNQMEILRALIPICAAAGKKLAVRFHPHLRFKDDSWRRDWDFDLLRDDNIVLIDPDSPIDSYSLASNSHCVATVGSTVGFECSYLGIPNVIVGDFIGGAMGASVQADDADELAAFMANPTLPEDAYNQALIYGSFYSVGGERLPDFDLRSHLSYARIEGKLVDPVRAALHPLRKLLTYVAKRAA